MKRVTRLGAALLLALGLAVPVAVPAAMAPAAAHGGKIDIELGTDGAGGVSAALTWAGDGHPVEESAVVVVRAVSDTGAEVGPVTLVSASEGVGWYRSEPELLGEGHWTVSAQVKEPRKATTDVQVDVAAPAAPPSESAAPEPEPSGSPAAGTNPDTDAAGAAAGDGSPSSGGLPGWTGWVLGALAVGGVPSVVLLRRRTT